MRDLNKYNISNSLWLLNSERHHLNIQRSLCKKIIKALPNLQELIDSKELKQISVYKDLLQYEKELKILNKSISILENKFNN